MDIQFNTDNSLSNVSGVAERVEAHLRERLGRFDDRLTRLEVHVGDTNGPKGGPDDIACTIEARPRGGAPLSASGSAGELDAAVRSASSKLVTVLDRHFGKSERHGR
ncbi:hypothetical protein A9995_13935 [Erythrobacter sp. QSSC1-22B]|uniref:HPF/RaiA family ribosome-associated protein n=1 Tax=Erythrobacter sp. QSSC1-22B TaxID=1860125 RepID=UPI000804E11A|nr:HPF/RaiA family ribosome-associated protein [Erythrobacter sp. QSSC1-22B]OBX18034.1 hypothetical protein A9995_13935 [Erythrobacter sp. QSSC1-22B]